jgi:hypothetical protein
MSTETTIINAIDASPLNRGLSGAAWIEHGGNVPIVMGDDIALFDDEGDSIYQVHVLFVSRGRAAVASLREALRQMFEFSRVASRRKPRRRVEHGKRDRPRRKPDC